jgi:ribosomal protein S19
MRIDLGIRNEKIKLLSKLIRRNKKEKNEERGRSSIVSLNDLEKRFLVHNGKKYVSIFIRPFMLGFKFGSFILTKRRMNPIHVDKAKKGKGKVMVKTKDKGKKK